MTEPPDAGLPAAVVFDLDGTLVDTETVSERVMAGVLADLGHEVTDEEIQSVRGRAFAWLREWMLDRFGVTEQEYRTLSTPRWRTAMEEGFATFDDTMAVLDRLRDLGVPLGLCTSSGRDSMEAVVASIGLDGQFAAMVSATDVDRHKPHPEPYREATRLLEAPPTRTVAIEDTRIGATAAVEAGLRVIGRPDKDRVDLADIVHVQVETVTIDAVRAVLADGTA